MVAAHHLPEGLNAWAVGTNSQWEIPTVAHHFHFPVIRVRLLRVLRPVCHERTVTASWHKCLLKQSTFVENLQQNHPRPITASLVPLLCLKFSS